jgi:hypothetical protein
MEARATAPAIHRRIEVLETDLRKMQRWLAEYPDSERYQRWIWFTENRIAFEHGLLKAIPAEAAPLTRDQLEVGGAVCTHHHWYLIDRVNQKTITYTAFGSKLKLPITDITPDKYRSPAQLKAPDPSPEEATAEESTVTLVSEPDPVPTVAPTSAIVPVSEVQTRLEAVFKPLPSPRDLLTPGQSERLEFILNRPQVLQIEVARAKHGGIRFIVTVVGREQPVRLIAFGDGGTESTFGFGPEALESLFTVYPVEAEHLNTLYTFGYAKATVEDLQKLVQEKDWWLVDIRMSPRSRQARWNMGSLKSQIGDNYIHAPAFGNKNYKSGGVIELADPELGLQIVSKLLATKPVILMCACGDVNHCHRLTAAEYVVARRDVKLIHLDPALVKTLVLPAAQPDEAAEVPVLTDAEVQLGMPGFGENRVVRLLTPVQQTLL